jgi:tetratricopeptide (TPR) repeat protein
MYRIKLLAMALMVLSYAALAQTDSNSKNLSYSITLNKSSYLPLEPIIVISKLKNVGTKKIEVEEPSARAFVVEFDLFKVDPNGRQNIHSKAMNGKGRWTVNKFILNPSDFCESSYELGSRGQIPNINSTETSRGSRGSNPGLQPGEYIVVSTYHLPNYYSSMADHEKQILIAEAPFRIVPMDANQNAICDEFVKSLRTEERGRPDPNFQIEKLTAFLKKYPNSIYQQLALDNLISFFYEVKNYEEATTYYREILKGEISTDRREQILYALGSTYLQLGQIKEAIEVLSSVKFPAYVNLREQLEKGQIPQEFRAAVEAAKKKSEPNKLKN